MRGANSTNQGVSKSWTPAGKDSPVPLGGRRKYIHLFPTHTAPAKLAPVPGRHRSTLPSDHSLGFPFSSDRSLNVPVTPYAPFIHSPSRAVSEHSVADSALTSNSATCCRYWLWTHPIPAAMCSVSSLADLLIAVIRRADILAPLVPIRTNSVL